MTTTGPPPNGAVLPHFVVVGIGADGVDGLSPRSRRTLATASVIYGSARQLGLIGDLGSDRIPWRSPMSDHLAAVLKAPATAPGADIHILASGDPMFHGIGSSVVRAVGSERLTVLPAVSSASLACAHLGWDLAQTSIVSTVTADPDVLLTTLTDGLRLLVLSRDGTTPRRIADLLVRAGFAESTMTVLEQLGGPSQRITTRVVGEWSPNDVVDPLNIVALECTGPCRSSLPGRPETEFDHDGQITKSAIRALTVCALTPTARHTLWDIGSGSGSVAIEWLRSTAGTRAVAFEKDTARAARIAGNAHRHGVADRLLVLGAVPGSLTGAPPPDAAFIGGGLSTEILETTWASLRPGGRLVANAVTIENQTLLTTWHQRHAGILRRIGVESATPLGGFSAWRPALPIVQWFGNTPGSSSPSGEVPADVRTPT